MDINYFDIVVGVIVLLLGLKGILNGFFKELFGLIGIIGGIFIASRFSEEVGTLVSNLVFKFDNASAINFTGFIITLVAFWIVMILIGMLLKKFASASGLGPIDKLFGFILGSAKFFLITTVIIYALNNITAIRQNIEPMMQNSVLYPVMLEVGGVIMKIDTQELGNNISDSIEKTTTKIEHSIKETTDEITDAKSEEVIETIKTEIDKAKENVKKESDEH